MKYVIVGTGIISSTYVNALADIPGSELLGCISRSGRRPAAAPGIPSWPDLASVPADFDAVIVATPNGLHCEGIVAAASAGKHVITEKPLGINPEQADRAIVACERAGVTLAVAYQRRTAPDNRAIKGLIDRGELGAVFAADLSAKFYRDQAYYELAGYRGGWAVDGGGPFMQQACHNIDLYTWFFGSPTRVLGMLGTFTHEIETEDHGAALLRHENGMIGTIVASTATKPGYAARLEVHSSLGSFTMTDDAITKWDIDEVANPADAGFAYRHDGATSVAVGDHSAHREIIVDFERAVAGGGQPLVDARSARATTELICRIYAAARGSHT
jgi:predicted dehydrogenase